MHCLFFICERKFYAHTHVKITRHWKSTLKYSVINSAQITSVRKAWLTIHESMSLGTNFRPVSELSELI